MMKSIFIAAIVLASCTGTQDASQDLLTTPGNPFLPLWEHIPDGAAFCNFAQK